MSCQIYCEPDLFIALSTRCLEAVMLIIPYVKKHFEVRLPPQKHVLLTQFDLVIEVS